MCTGAALAVSICVSRLFTSALRAPAEPTLGRRPLGAERPAATGTGSHAFDLRRDECKLASDRRKDSIRLQTQNRPRLRPRERRPDFRQFEIDRQDPSHVFSPLTERETRFGSNQLDDTRRKKLAETLPGLGVALLPGMKLYRQPENRGGTLRRGAPLR
jgi:hypothetical protein